MSYPKDTPYGPNNDYIIREYDPAYQANPFQGLDKNHQPVTLFCKDREEAKLLIEEWIRQTNED